MAAPGAELSAGVPLGHYRTLGAGVRLTCRDCQLHRDLALEAVIARLEARGTGGAATGIRQLAGLVTRPCERCGGRCFVSAPAFPSGAAKL
ncbi:MAG: hypothetical protein ACHP7N_00275 [Caulobacterales bacterium]